MQKGFQPVIAEKIGKCWIDGSEELDFVETASREQGEGRGGVWLVPEKTTLQTRKDETCGTTRGNLPSVHQRSASGINLPELILVGNESASNYSTRGGC